MYSAYLKCNFKFAELRQTVDRNCNQSKHVVRTDLKLFISSMRVYFFINMKIL